MMVSFERRFTLCLITWFSLSLSIPITDALGYNNQSFLLRLLITGCALILFVFFSSYPLFILIFPIPLLIFAFLSYLFNPAMLETIVRSLYHLLVTNETLWFIGIVSSITLVLLLLLTRATQRLLLLFLIGVFVFIPLWYLFVDSAYASAVSYASGWLLLLSYQSGHRIWMELPRENRVRFRRGWLNYTYLVLILSLSIAVFLPKNISPVTWTAFQVWADETFPFLSDLRGGQPYNLRGEGGWFSVAVAGFGEPTQLGGPVKPDKTILMEVNGSGGHYLRGTVMDDYTGRSWVVSGEPSTWEPSQVKDALLDYLKPVELKVTHKRLRTVTVFSLPYTVEISGFKESLYQTEGRGVIAATEVPVTQAYYLRGMALAFDNSFSELEAEHGQPEPDLALWLKLPEGLPARVRDLARSITQEQPGIYAQMKALEGYLRNTYPYSESPAVLPENRDFVDFFLFDEKTGYCTSFASALTVMARSIGIPARYVQGFKMPEEAGAQGNYRIAGTDAHAWVEAFIPGVGWLTFEATPIYTPLESLPSEAPPNSVTNLGLEEDHRPRYLLVHYPGLLMTLVSALPLSAAALFASIIFRRWLRLKSNIKRIQRLPLRLQVSAHYNMTLMLLAGIGLGKSPGETPREYSARVNRHVYNWNLSFKTISEGMNISLYSESGETPEWLAEQTQAFFESTFKRYLVTVGRRVAFIELLVQRRYFTDEFFSDFLD